MENLKTSTPPQKKVLLSLTGRAEVTFFFTAEVSARLFILLGITIAIFQLGFTILKVKFFSVIVPKSIWLNNSSNGLLWFQ